MRKSIRAKSALMKLTERQREKPKQTKSISMFLRPIRSDKKLNFNEKKIK